MKNRTLVVLLMMLLLPVLLYGQNAEQPRFNLVIDPGHGGALPGFTVQNDKYQEKTYTLAISLKLAALIEKHLPDVNLMMTRTTDIALGPNRSKDLVQRAKIANTATADLFLSIHINSAAPNANVHGLRCFVLGPDNINDNIKEIQTVCSVDEITAQIMSDEATIQSFKFAATIVKQCQIDLREMCAGDNMIYNPEDSYYVLSHTVMPSVLVEVAFMSNADDLARLQTDEFQNRVAVVLFNALSEYIASTQQRGVAIYLPVNEPAVTSAKPATPVTAAAAVATPTTDAASASATPSGILYYVQIMAVREAQPTTGRLFRSWAGKVSERYVNGWHKYMVGGVESYDEIMRLQTIVRNEFPDAFVVVFDGEAQITVDQARGRR